MRYNKISFFHGVIVAFLLLGVYGCGHKGTPKYKDKRVEAAVQDVHLVKVFV